MLEILAISSPIYLIVLLGFVFVRCAAFSKSDIRVLGKFVTHLAMPALIFNAIAQRPVGEIFNVSYLAAYALGTLALIVAGMFWARRIAGLAQTTSAIRVMGMTCSNSGFIGYPILLLIVAPVAGIALALNMLVENLVIIPLMLLLAERGRGAAGERHVLRKSFLRLLRNPLILAILAGLAVSLPGLPLPAPAARTINMFAATSGALSLFVIGGTLVGLPLRGLGKEVSPVAFAKLVLHPLLVFAAIKAVPMIGLPAIDPSLRLAAIIIAAVPMISIYVTLAQAYGEEEVSAAAQLVTTIASFFTLSGLLWLFAHFPP
jgi:predicted permease